MAWRRQRQRGKPSLRVTSRADEYGIGPNKCLMQCDVKLKSSLGIWRNRRVCVLQHCILAFDASKTTHSLNINCCIRVEFLRETCEIRIETSSSSQGFGRIRIGTETQAEELYNTLQQLISCHDIIQKEQPEMEVDNDWQWQDSLGCWREFNRAVRDQMAQDMSLGKTLIRVEQLEIDLNRKVVTEIQSGRVFGLRNPFQGARSSLTNTENSLTDHSEALVEQLNEISTVCKSLDESFVDPSFPPSFASLFLNGQQVQTEWDCGNCTLRNSSAGVQCFNCKARRIIVKRWLRPVQAAERWRIFDDKPSPQDIQQGALGNCWFLSALAVLAERPELLRKLITNTEYNPAGVYLVNLCKDGIWQSILIDDFFPCSENGRLAYSQASRKQLWVPLIEKAMAKMFGCYEAIASGQIYDGLSILTGQPVKKISLRRDRNMNDGLMRVNSTSALGMMGYEDENLDDDILWIQLLSFREAGYLMGASCGIFEDDAANEIYMAVGLQRYHAYSVLDVQSVGEHRLVLLRNPWGQNDRRKWNGDWSSTSHLWTDELKKQLESDGSGIFWMSFSDLRKYFGRIDVCKIRENWVQDRFEGKLLTRDCQSIDIFTISSTTTNEIEVSLQQRSDRGVVNPPPPNDICLAVLRCSKTTGHYELVADATRTTSIYVSVEVILEPGFEYVIVPLGFNKMVDTIPTNYVVTVHSAVHLNTSRVSSELQVAAQAMALRARKHGECKQIFDRMVIYTQSHDAGTVIVAENRHPNNHFLIEMDSQKSFNLCSSRDAYYSLDCIPPNHFQVLQVFSQVTESGYSWSSKSKYSAASKSEEHIPPVFAPGLHCPQRFLTTYKN